MRRRIAAAFTIAAVTMALAIAPAVAQPGQLPDFKPPPPAPIKPYKAVAVTPPAPFNDPGFVAFRKQLGDVAAHKDRAALAKLVVAQNFFWVQDKDLADKRKPASTISPRRPISTPGRFGLGCPDRLRQRGIGARKCRSKRASSAHRTDPAINPAEFEALGKATQTEPSDWGYPTADGVEVHAAASRTRRSSRSSG